MKYMTHETKQKQNNILNWRAMYKEEKKKKRKKKRKKILMFFCGCNIEDFLNKTLVILERKRWLRWEGIRVSYNGRGCKNVY